MVTYRWVPFKIKISVPLAADLEIYHCTCYISLSEYTTNNLHPAKVYYMWNEK